MAEKGIFWEGISEGMAQKLEKLMEKVPLLGSYPRRENARERDKIVREHIAQEIDHLKGEVMKLMESQTEKKELAGLDKLDRLARKLDKLRDTIKFSSHGYSGVFDRVKILDTELERLMDYDLAILAKVEDMEKKLSAMPADETKANAELSALTSFADELERTVEDRMFAVTKGTQETPPPAGGQPDSGTPTS
jgi:septation ring formation regulator EzrA